MDNLEATHTKKMTNKTENKLRFQIQISADIHPELFAFLNMAGPYKMSKCMVGLALSGLMIGRGDAPITAGQPIQKQKKQIQATKTKLVVDDVPTNQTKTAAEVITKTVPQEGGEVPKQITYRIPDGNDEDLNALFEIL